VYVQLYNMTAILLTTTQINEILRELSLPLEQYSEALKVSVANTRDNLQKKLSTTKLAPDKFPIFKKIIIEQFFKSIVAPGEAVGTNAAQNISEPTTQGTLNTFHNTGISAKNVTLGFQRATELYNATDIDKQSTPTCCIYFVDNNKTVNDLHVYTDQLPQLCLESLVTHVKTYEYDNYVFLYDISETDSTISGWWIPLYCQLHDITVDESAVIIRIKLQEDRLYEHNIDLQTVKERLEQQIGVVCICSPLNLGILDILCMGVDISSIHIVISKILQLSIGGIKNITKVYQRKVGNEWIVDTDGTNLREVLNFPGVDQIRTISNSVWEIYSVLGIEACRLFLLKEFGIVISSSGSYINPRHIELLVDKMTNTGTIKAIARYGIEIDQYPPIMRATFEETMKHLVNSAVGSEVDNLTGISSSVVTGKKIRAGTGFVKLTEKKLRLKSSKQSNE